MQRYAYAFLAFLAIGIAGYSIVVYGFLPLGSIVHPDMRVNFEAHATTVYVHIFASSIALLCGVLQFSTSLRTRRPLLHRYTGRIYFLLGVIPGGVAGLMMAINAYGGIVSQLGFGLLALLWFYTGWQAYMAIRSGQVQLHQQWMTRNYALTCAAITLRIYLPLSMVSGIPFELAYPAIAWLCWVPNLIYAQLRIQNQALLSHASPT